MLGYRENHVRNTGIMEFFPRMAIQHQNPPHGFEDLRLEQYKKIKKAKSSTIIHHPGLGLWQRLQCLQQFQTEMAQANTRT